MINFYERIKKVKNPKNPNYGIEHYIKIPSRILICAPSGGGKTNTLMNIIYRTDRTFNKIILCVKDADEPLYNHLKGILRENELEIYEDGIIPDMDNYDKNTSKLIIFDDLVLERNQKKMIEFYIRGRKKLFTCVYLSQNYHSTPIVIRRNINYLILCRNITNKDLKNILSNFPSNLDLNDFIELYYDYVKNMNDALFFDFENAKIYYNFNNLISSLN